MAGRNDFLVLFLNVLIINWNPMRSIVNIADWFAIDLAS